MKRFTACFYIIIFLFVFGFQTAHSQNNEEIRLANEYYTLGQFEKAKLVYEKLAKDYRNISLIHNNYYFLLLEQAEFPTAEKYIKKLIKRFPQNLYYRLDYGLIAYRKGETDQADKWYRSIIKDIEQDTYKVRITAEYFVNKQLTDYAILTFQSSREVYNDDLLYSLELANIYRIISQKDLMVEEYLKYMVQNPSNLNYVKNSLQNYLTEPDELATLESLLYDRIQRDPENDTYAELLIWVSLQQKNFYGAFIQARAMDKRKGTEGTRSNEIGLIAIENKDFDAAIKIFSYVIKEYPKTVNYIMAKMYLIKAYEERVRNTYPVDKREIRNLVNDYNLFISELGTNRNTLDALRNKALLHAFYLDEKDSAITILQDIIKTPRASREIKSKSKIDLGDIYLLTGQPWESTLLYSQVEKVEKENAIGHQAKLKNAKLSYYKGEFSLAEEHLDILKQATSRKISNDAIALSLLIKDNTALDSSAQAMSDYSKIELLLFQNKNQEAFTEISKMKEKYPSHSLIDELLWLESDILKRMGRFEESIPLLEQVVAANDILSDDAYFSIANIYDRQLNAKDKAMQQYREFLTKYPGSVYVAEARKRFRILRGDNQGQKVLN